MVDSMTLTEMVAKAACDKKANDIVILDMQNISLVTDYFVICSAYSTTQVKAIADNIEENLSKQGYSPSRKEGYREGHWVLLDYGDCVAHVFVEEERRFYNLEKLWGDASIQQYSE